MIDCPYIDRDGVFVCPLCGDTKPKVVRRNCPIGESADNPQKSHPEPIDHGADCPHRGAQLRELKCQLCGQKDKTVPVYECALFGEAAARKYKVGTKGVVTCQGCERVTPDQSPQQPTP